MKRISIYSLGVSLLIAFGFWWFSPTQILKRKTGSLLTTLTLDTGHGKISRQMRSFTFNKFLAPQVTLQNPTINEANGTFERSELDAIFSWLCEQAKQTQFKVKEFQSITLAGEQAQVMLRLDGLVELPSYRPADGTYDAVFDWKKHEDGWRVTRASWQKTP